MKAYRILLAAVIVVCLVLASARCTTTVRKWYPTAPDTVFVDCPHKDHPPHRCPKR